MNLHLTSYGGRVLRHVLLACLLAARVHGMGVAKPASGPVVLQDAALLTPPPELAGRTGFTIARTPPQITFSMVQGLAPLPAESNSVWTNFSEGVCSANGKFYVAFSNNAGIDGNCCVYEYDPATHAQRRVLDMARLLGQKPGAFGHGKLHGRLDEMPDGWIYMASYCSLKDPALSPEQRSRFGSRLVRLNTRTSAAEDLGVPGPGETYPMNGTDTRRAVFHGIGLLGGYLAYDLRAHRCIYQDKVPSDLGWGDRATLIDPETGRVYSSDPMNGQIVCYDPQAKRFSRTKAFLPSDQPGRTEAHPGIRSYTRCRLSDGCFIAQTSTGLMFRFYPDREQVVPIGPNWLDGCYCPASALTSDGAYLYYTPGSHEGPVPGGLTLIRMDTRTNARKVIAFIQESIVRRLSYVLGTSYSISLDDKNESLLLTCNGHKTVAFGKQPLAGEPCFLYIRIPQGERATKLAE